MKQIELNLQKRLLIVEAEPEFEPKEGVEYYVPEDAEELFILPKGTFKLICKGSKLTEEIADEFAEPYDLGFYASYDGHKYSFEQTALESFISAIESNNMFWKKHNVPYPSIYDPRSKTRRFEIGEELKKAELEYKKAESRTFNLDKTLIFEILT